MQASEVRHLNPLQSHGLYSLMGMTT
jgi:hypothetical protein